MRAVASATVHLAFEKRMRKSFESFAALQLVAIEADFRLRRGLHHGIARRMADVAIGTGNLVIVMWPTVPAEADIRIVASQAHVILDADFGFLTRAELDHWRAFLAAPYARCVCPTGAVACLALQLTVAKRAAWIGRHCVSGTKNCQGQLIVVAGQAGIGAFSTVGNFRCRSFCCLCSHQCRNENTKQEQSKIPME